MVSSEGAGPTPEALIQKFRRRVPGSGVGGGVFPASASEFPTTARQTVSAVVPPEDRLLEQAGKRSIRDKAGEQASGRLVGISQRGGRSGPDDRWVRIRENVNRTAELIFAVVKNDIFHDTGGLQARILELLDKYDQELGLGGKRGGR